MRERLLPERPNWRSRSQSTLVWCVSCTIVSTVRRETWVQWEGSVCVQRPVVSVRPLAGRGRIAIREQLDIHHDSQKKHPELSVTDITERIYVHKVTTSEDILSFMVASVDCCHLGLARRLHIPKHQTDRDRFHGNSLSSRCEPCTSVRSL